jgi:hypothetical protein
MEWLDLSLENGMNYTSNDEAAKRDDIGDEDSANLLVVAADRPSQVEKRRHADEPADEGHSLVRRLERSKNHESTEQAEKNGPMSHEYFEVWLIELKPVERRQSLTSHSATQRKQMNDANQHQHR